MRSNCVREMSCLVLVGLMASPAIAAGRKPSNTPTPPAASRGDASAGTGAAADAPAVSPPVSATDSVTPPVDVPVMAPFTGPASGRVMQPPAPTPEGPAGNLEGDIESEALKQVITSAGKRAQKIREVPMTVAYIPASELEGTGQFTLCDAVQYFPGLECRRGAMRKAAVSARGLGSNFLSNRMLLLTDGRPETDPWTGIFYPDETYPLTNIKQIEVIRGPGSSLYGSNAFSGVINVIRRSPDDLIKEGRDWGADLRLMGGQDNTYRLQTTVAGRIGELKGLINYYGLLSDGPHLLNNPATAVVDTQEWSKIHQVSGKVEFSIVSLDVDYTNSALGRPGGQAISEVGNCGRCHYTPRDSEHLENLNSTLKVDAKVNDWLTLFGEAYALFKRREVFLENQITKEMQRSLGKRRRVGGEARALFSVGGIANITVGGDVKNDLVNNQNVLPGVNALVDAQGNAILDTHDTVYGAFVDAEVRPISNLIIGAGARYDSYDIPTNIWTQPSSEISPRASIVYNVMPELTLRTNYGRAFRAPTFAELAINQQMYASTLQGNPNLKAETLDTVEASVDAWPAGGLLRLTATGFYEYAHNFINQQQVGGSTSQFQNIGNARVLGLEAEIAANVPKINSSFDVAYQYLDAQRLNEGDSTPQGQLDYAPNHRLYLRAHTNVSRNVFADFYAVYVGARFDPARTVLPEGTHGDRILLPGYVVANARVGVMPVDGLSLSLLAENLFDARYEEMHGFPQQGIRLFAELKYAY